MSPPFRRATGTPTLAIGVPVAASSESTAASPLLTGSVHRSIGSWTGTVSRSAHMLIALSRTGLRRGAIDGHVLPSRTVAQLEHLVVTGASARDARPAPRLGRRRQSDS